jgi:hypothetical protein
MLKEIDIFNYGFARSEHGVALFELRIYTKFARNKLLEFIKEHFQGERL